MGTCVYCGKPAGLFRKQHKECHSRSLEGAKEIINILREEVISRQDFQEIEQRINVIAQEKLYRSRCPKKILARGWDGLIKDVFKRGSLVEFEDDRLSTFINYFKLSQQDLDANGSFSNFVKASVIRQVEEGEIPEKMRVKGDLPFNFQKGEKLVWLFQGVDYAEGDTLKDAGMMGVTTRHIYFNGESKGFRIKYSKIIAFDEASNGLCVQRDAVTAKPQFFLTEDGWFVCKLVKSLAQLDAVGQYEKNVPEELDIHHEVEKRSEFIEGGRRLDEAYGKWKFIAELEARKLRKSERWESDYPPLEMDLEGFPKWFYPLIPKEDFGDNEFKTLAARTNPNCGSIKGLAVAVRKVIRAKKKAAENYDSAINFLYRLAFLYEILDQLYFSIDDCSYKTRLHSFLAVSDLENISIDFDKIGYDKLSLLNKTDRSIIRAKWGSPKEHHGPLELFPAVINNCVSRDFWEGSRRDSVPIEDWIKGRLSSEIEFAREMEKSDRFCSASQTLKSIGNVYIVIDIETTGLSSADDEIVEIAALKVEDGRPTSDGFSSLVKIEGRIPHEATRVNGSRREC